MLHTVFVHPDAECSRVLLVAQAPEVCVLGLSASPQHLRSSTFSRLAMTTQPSRVCTLRSWRYCWEEGDITFEWTLLLENGEWSFIGSDGMRRPCGKDTKYYFSAKLSYWCDFDAHPRRLQCKQWHELSTRLLPYLEVILQSGQWRAKQIKQWSNYGEIRRYGDVGNRVMSLVIDMALELGKRFSVAWTGYSQVEQRNTEHKADFLELVMGLRVLQPTNNWVAWGNLVDDICTDVHEAWSSPELVNVWDPLILTEMLFARFGLDDFSAWHYKLARSQSRMAFATVKI